MDNTNKLSQNQDNWKNIVIHLTIFI